MIPKLSTELSNALQQQSGPLEVADQQGTRQYVIVAKDDYRKLVEHEFRQWLQVGLDQEARGEVAEWNLSEMLAEARRRFGDAGSSA